MSEISNNPMEADMSAEETIRPVAEVVGDIQHVRSKWRLWKKVVHHDLKLREKAWELYHGGGDMDVVLPRLRAEHDLAMHRHLETATALTYAFTPQQRLCRVLDLDVKSRMIEQCKWLDDLWHEMVEHHGKNPDGKLCERLMTMRQQVQEMAEQHGVTIDPLDAVVRDEMGMDMRLMDVMEYGDVVDRLARGTEGLMVEMDDQELEGVQRVLDIHQIYHEARARTSHIHWGSWVLHENDMQARVPN